MFYLKISSVVLVALMSICCSRQSNEQQTVAYDYKLQKVVSDLNNPWGMAFLPDKSMLITEKSGQLIHFKNANKTTISGLPTIDDNGQGGLLDIVLHPNYEQNGWLYFTYASPQGNGPGSHTALMRAKLNGNTLQSKELLYKATPNTTSAVHYGSRIAFDNDGYLYFSIGERGARDVNPQNINRDGGKIYRLNDDGSIPTDNPFYNSAGAKKAIYSYGHRNPQGLAKHPQTGKIWSHEHGPKGGDEINIIAKGENYGWPVVSYGVNYDGTSFTDNTSAPGMTQPIHYWVPSIAPCGMAFVNSDTYPDWKGGLLMGSLKFQYLHYCKLQGEKVIKEKVLFEDIGRVRNVVQAPDGYVYIAVEGDGIYRIIPE